MKKTKTESVQQQPSLQSTVKEFDQSKMVTALPIQEKVSKFYFAKINRKNTKTMLKYDTNVKNVSVKNG